MTQTNLEFDAACREALDHRFFASYPNAPIE